MTNVVPIRPFRPPTDLEMYAAMEAHAAATLVSLARLTERMERLRRAMAEGGAALAEGRGGPDGWIGAGRIEHVRALVELALDLDEATDFATGDC